MPSSYVENEKVEDRFGDHDPIGYHYHPCSECRMIFVAKTTESPYDDEETWYWNTASPDVEQTPVRCGCDGVCGEEDKLCKDCMERAEEDAYDGYDEEGDFDIRFADPTGHSALRAEYGVRNGKCVSVGCGQAADLTDNFCRRCGHGFDQRNQPCPTCGRQNVLTSQDRDLHYQCDICSDQAEGRMPNAWY